MSTTDLSNRYTSTVIVSIGEKLYLNEEMADFHFVFKSADGQHVERIPAHKIILINASNIFGAMMQNKSKANITDATPSAFKEFLQFIYLSHAKVTNANAIEVMYLGDKYNIPDCIVACKDFLMKTLTLDTVCHGYDAAVCLAANDLIAFCEENIKSHASKVLTSSSFLHCNRKLLSRILNLDLLYCTAAELIEACMSWVKLTSMKDHLTKKLVQEHLQNLFYELPFGLMSLDEFDEFHRAYKHVLQYEERVEIRKMIESKDYASKIFKTNRKTFHGISLKWDEGAVVQCDRTLYGSENAYFIKNTEKTVFSTNKTLLLGAIVCERLSKYK